MISSQTWTRHSEKLVYKTIREPSRFGNLLYISYLLQTQMIQWSFTC